MSISVALCTYQGAEHLPEQLASLLGQSRSPDEVVVCDDGSTDGTWSLLEEFAAQAPFQVVLERNGVRLGFRDNFALALGRTRGELVSLCDQDDVWRPDRLEVLSSALDDDPQALLAFSDANMVGPRLEDLGYRLWEALGFDDGTQRALLSPGAVGLLMHRNYVTGATAMVRSTLLRWALPLPSTDLIRFHDAWLALVAATASRLCAVHEPLVSYRQHGRQQTGVPPAARRGALRKGAQDVQRDWELGRQVLQAEELLHRLDEPGSPPPLQGVPSFLQAHAEHMRLRSGLPRSALQRGALVAREVAAGRYARHSSGARSAVKDLVRGGRSS